jgi:hypothetical protein
VLLGIWKDSSDDSLLHGRVLKNTRGRPGGKFKMTIDGEKMLITPRVPRESDPVDNSRSYSASKEYQESKVKKGRYGEKDET